ncbi:RidA family protein [Daejeonella sp. JGW-45]|uniref:RidA family protein n=1 Tax=Daejeonella sp. JGW-45 TaxID=3034148 RepID=UPI0023EAD79C|nr:RidA family protein [Daejeonella sp. JGW-45]
MELKRRSVLKRLMAAVAGVAAAGSLASATEVEKDEKISRDVTNLQDVPLFAGSTQLGRLVFISGTGADAASVHDIRKDTDFVLKKMEKRLIDAGSSMEKVLKVTVFLDDLADFEGMNEIYKGRFGKNPPARSTVAVAKGGIPGKSILEIDCIAYV